jgi:UDP-N-acetylmuramoylalanine--D-glutamate ligase
LNIFLNKKILIYGLGKSGISSFKFLKKKSEVYLFDDNLFKIQNFILKKNIINYKNILKTKFDQIIISPGIDINKCKLSKFLKKNNGKIYSDLDVFYSFYKNICITITGTNGKSTTCQLLYKILLDQKIDVKLVGNIGNPILSVKKVNKKTIFIIEASSYQLEYSKIFKSKYAAILNISPDHIERHKTLKKYIQAKFKLLKNQSKGSFAFVNKNNFFINKELQSYILKSKVIKVNTKKRNKIIDNTENDYFLSETNKENFLFAFEISKKFNPKYRLIKQTIQKFNGLKYRQQIIYKKKYLTIINDSKSTSFSSSIGLLKSNKNIYWLLGGIYKKGDKLDLPKNYFKNIKAFVYGKNRKFFNKTLNGKIDYKNFDNLKDALKKIFLIIKKEKLIFKTILFSPCAASFDSFKNFEDRGFYFNKLIKMHLNGKK